MPSSTSRKTTTKDPALAQKAKLLKETPYFVVDNNAFLYEKQLIFYVLAGVKLASEVGSCHMEELSPTYLESRPDDQQEVAAFLESLGLHYAFKSSYNGTVTVSLDEELIRTYHHLDTLTDEASIYEAYGRLYGYPETAVAACVANWVHDQPTLMNMEEQEQIEREAGLPRGTAVFRFSKAHWQAELAVVRDWYAVLVQYGMG
jgi:hypothetical protein